MLNLSTDPIEKYSQDTVKDINLNKFYKFITFNRYNGKILSIGNNYVQDKESKNTLCKKFIVKNTNVKKLDKLLVNFDIKKNNYILTNKNAIVLNQDKNLTRNNFNYVKFLKNHNKKYDFRFIQFLDNNNLLIECNYNFLKNFIKHEKLKTIDLYFVDKFDYEFIFDKITINLKELVQKKQLLLDISKIRSFVNPLNLQIVTKKILQNYECIVINSFQEIQKINNTTYNIQTIKNNKNKDVDLIFNFDFKNKKLYVKKTKYFYNLDLVDRQLKFYVMNPDLDYCIEKIVFNTNDLINAKETLELSIPGGFKKNDIIIHKYNYLKINYENTYN